MAQSEPPQSILVQIIAYAPTQFFHCQHCEVVWQEVGAAQRVHQEQLESSIPEDLRRQYADISAWVRATVESYDGRVVFKVIDAASMEGWLKSVRFAVRHYPAFIVDGRAKYVGTEFSQVKQLIDERIQMVQPSGG